MARRILLRGGTLIDGSGAPGRVGDLLIEDDRIAELGDSLPPDEAIDVRGLVVAPGFIDVHSHGDFTLPVDPEAPAKVLQGVTTEVVGNCGLGLYPANDKVDAMYERVTPLVFGESGAACSPSLAHYRARIDGRGGISVNAAPLLPHGNLRCAVMGLSEGAATESEIATMREWVERGMAEGAFGVSTGLIYPPGAYAQTDEIVRVVEPLARTGGIYATHMRNEGGRVVEAVAEAISIGERAGVPVQISHHKAAGRFNWGKVQQTLALVDAANARGMNVHSDVYPYTAGSTVLSAMFIPLWAFEGSTEQLIARIKNPETRQRIIADSKAQLLAFVDLPWWLSIVPKQWLLPIIIRKLGEAILISSVKRQRHLEGRAIGEIAKERGQKLHDAMLDLLVEEDTAVAAIAHAMCEEDVQAVLKHPRTMVGTDGFPLREGKPHPRTYGTYPRILEHYVGKLGLLSLEQAIHRMTGMIATKLGLKGRGVLAKGAAADVVVFDAKAIHDRATFEDPRNSPKGIAHVFVGGAATVRDGKHTGARRGRVLSRLE